MGAIIDFFVSMGEFFSGFADSVKDGIQLITDFVQFFPMFSVPILAILAMYVVYSLLGRN